MNIYKRLSLFLCSIFAVFFLSIMLFLNYNYTSILENYVNLVETNTFSSLSGMVSDTYTSVRHVFGSLTFYSNDNSSIMSTLRDLNEKGDDTNGYDIYRASENIKNACQSLVYNYNFVEGVYVFSQNGQMFSHTKNWTSGMQYGYDPSKDYWYQQTKALNGSIYIGTTQNYDMFLKNGENCILAQTIRDADNNFTPIGTVLLQCDPLLFDPTEKIIAENINYLEVKNSSTGEVIYSFGDKHTETSDFIYQCAQSVSGTPLFLSFEMNNEELVKGFRTVFVSSVLLMLFVMIGLVIITCIVLHRELYPLTVLCTHMSSHSIPQLIEDEKYMANTDEIGILYRHYNQMIETMNLSIQNEYQYRLLTIDAQIQSMEASINAHFLFNTLESINSIAELNDNQEICDMSLALGNMLRYAIKTKSELVTLEQELKNTLDYNLIQQLRFSHRYRLIQDVPDVLLGTPMLKLILQPIVENSLLHGLDHCSCGSYIKISAKIVDNTLFLTVTDDGKGISPDRLKELHLSLQQPASIQTSFKKQSQSIGLKNIQSRIEIYYGKGYGISVESREHEYTAVTVNLPVLSSGEE